MYNDYKDKIQGIIPDAIQALEDISRCLDQGNVRYHANETWGGRWADECVQNANQSIKELKMIYPDQVASEIERARQEGQVQGLKMAYAIANRFSTKKDRSLHPDIPWDRMNDSAQIVAHSASQQIAQEIYLIIHPDGGVWGKQP